MTVKGAGRPRSAQKKLSRQAVLKEALAFIDAQGPTGFTMRGLARRMNVTPMAIYHHAGSRRELLKAMVAEAFANVADRSTAGPVFLQIEALLKDYCARVLQHPNVTLAVFRDATLFAGPPAALTSRLQYLLEAHGLEPQSVSLWLGVLVDFTHGFALSMATALEKQAGRQAAMEDYSAALAALLGAIDQSMAG